MDRIYIANKQMHYSLLQLYEAVPAASQQTIYPY